MRCRLTPRQPRRWRNLVNALASRARARKGAWVQIPLSALFPAFGWKQLNSLRGIGKYMRQKTRAFTAVVVKEDDLFVAECPEVGTASQGKTVKEAIANLKEATELYLKEFPGKVVPRPILTTFEVEEV